MATYTELRQLFSDDALKNKIDFAVVVAAETLLSGTPTAAEQMWAAHVAAGPRAESDKAFMFMLATNKAATVEGIQTATDASIQTAVDAVVDTLVLAHAG